MVKWGPEGSTDCADRDGYKAFRRQPVSIAAREAPLRFCAIGFDDAGNPSAPASRVLR
jgi:hypothetical protein